MPDFAWVAIVFFGGPLALMVLINRLGKRSRAKFSSEGAVAETFASEDDGSFVLGVPANSAPLGVYVEYSVEARRPAGGSGRHYGFTLRLDVERADFQQRGEYLIGDAAMRTGDVPAAQSLAGSMIRAVGMHVSRTILVARVPAGDAFRVTGKVFNKLGDRHSVLVFAKPPVG